MRLLDFQLLLHLQLQLHPTTRKGREKNKSEIVSHLSGTVMEIWCLKDMYTDGHIQHGTTDRTTNLLISSNVHYVHTWQR